MGLTRPLTSLTRSFLVCTTKAKRATTLRTFSSTSTIMGALNGQSNGVDAKQNGARTNLVGIADRLEEGRALAQDVWSVFKCVLYLATCSSDL